MVRMVQLCMTCPDSPLTGVLLSNNEQPTRCLAEGQHQPILFELFQLSGAQQNKEVVFEPFEKKEESAPPNPAPRSSRRKRKAIEINDDSESDDDQPQTRQRNGRALSVGQQEATGSPMSAESLQDDQEYFHVKDEEDEDGFVPPRAPAPPLFMQDDEDEKPEGKPKLKVNYTGFRSVGRV